MQAVFNAMGGQRKITLENVTIRGESYTVSLNPSIVGKIASDQNMTAEKLAVFLNLDSLVQGADFVGSGNYNKITPKNDKVIRYDYFEKSVTIEEIPYILTFDVEVYKPANNFRTYRIIKGIGLEPVAKATSPELAIATETPNLFDTSIVRPGTENVNGSAQNRAFEIEQEVRAAEPESMEPTQTSKTPIPRMRMMFGHAAGTVAGESAAVCARCNLLP